MSDEVRTMNTISFCVFDQIKSQVIFRFNHNFALPN